MGVGFFGVSGNFVVKLEVGWYCSRFVLLVCRCKGLDDWCEGNDIGEIWFF